MEHCGKHVDDASTVESCTNTEETEVVQRLEYFNDRKGKSQSHEINLTNICRDFDIESISSTFQCSCGSDLLEALTSHYNAAVSLQYLLNSYIDNMRTGNFCIVDKDGKEVKTWTKDFYYSGDTEEYSTSETIQQFINSINDKANSTSKDKWINDVLWLWNKSYNI